MRKNGKLLGGEELKVRVKDPALAYVLTRDSPANVLEQQHDETAGTGRLNRCFCAAPVA